MTKEQSLREEIARWFRPFALKEVEGHGEDYIVPWDECCDDTKKYWLGQAEPILTIVLSHPEWLKEQGYVKLDKDQSLPDNPYWTSRITDNRYVDGIYHQAYKDAQQDMLKAGFRKIEALEAQDGKR